MNDNLFFKPTPLYREYMILDLVEKDSKITQRDISQVIGTTVSMVNTILDDLEQRKLIKRTKYSSKNVEYNILKKGIERRKLLNIWYIKASHHVYQSAKDNIIVFMRHLKEMGYHKLLLYGAGEMAQIILNVFLEERSSILSAIIDDDPLKQDRLLMDIPVISLNQINNYLYDGILISSYTHKDKMNKSLLSQGINKEKIIHFFD